MSSTTEHAEPHAEMTADDLISLVGEDFASMIEPGVLAHAMADTQLTDINVTARDVAVARALLSLVSGSALLNGDKKAILDAGTLYRLICTANSLLIGRLAAWDARQAEPGVSKEWVTKMAELEAAAGWDITTGAEPGELPPLPGPVVNWPKNIAMADGGEVLAATYYSADQMNAHARHALATSPLPAEQVERVMFAVNEALDMQGRFTIGKASGADVRNSLAAVRAILEGRS